MKVKHLIKRLQALDPEANVYFGEASESKPADYLLPGTRLKRGYFLLTTEVERYDGSPDLTDRSLVDHLLRRYGGSAAGRGDLHDKDLLISNWSGKWEGSNE
jgi:hypothetical protein